MSNTILDIIQEKGTVYYIQVMFNTQLITSYKITHEQITNFAETNSFVVITLHPINKPKHETINKQEYKKHFFGFIKNKINNSTYTSDDKLSGYNNNNSTFKLCILSTNKIDLINELNTQLKIYKKENMPITNIKMFKQQIHNIIKNIQQI
jgi:hypothetical protein